MNEQFDYEEVFMGVLKTFKPEYRVKRLTEALKLSKGRLLDIGCAGGVLTETLVKHYPKVEIYGCDISKTAISYAKKYGSGKVTYAAIKGKRFPYGDKFFDACICLDVLEHVPDVDLFLKEVRRVLKDNGHFFLLVPCEGQPFTYTWFFQKLNVGTKLTFKHWGHIHPEFTHRSVVELLRKHGFTPLKKSYSEHTLWQLLNVFMYFIPHAILERVIGKKATLYTDSGVVRSMEKGKQKQKKDLMMFLRSSCLELNSLLRLLTFWELDLFKNLSLNAMKISILAKK